MTRRSRLETLMDVMKVIAAEPEARRTRIMYRANLTWKNLEEAIDIMEKKGLLLSHETGAGVFFTLTNEGQTLLQRYHEVEGAIFAGGNNIQSLDVKASARRLEYVQVLFQ